MRIALLFICLLALAAPARAASGDAAFDAFVASAWPPAQAAGVSRETFARETAGLTPDPAIKARPAQWFWTHKRWRTRPASTPASEAAADG